MKKTTLITLAAASAILAGCAATPTGTGHPGIEAIRYGSDSALLLLDSKPATGKGREQLLSEIIAAARAQLPDITIARSAPRFPLPSEKPSFKLVDPNDATHSGSIAKLFAQQAKVPACENTVLTVQGVNADAKETGEQARLFICVMQYDGGFRTAISASYEKDNDLFKIPKLSKAAKVSSVGGELFIPKTMHAVRAAVEQNTVDTKVIDPGVKPQ